MALNCFKCGNKGHLARNCRNQGNGRGHIIPASRECPPALVSACITHSIPVIKHNTMRGAAYITGKVNNQKVQMLLDFGASCSVVSKKHINIYQVSPGHSIQLVNADGR